jgi:hypothetical protein
MARARPWRPDRQTPGQSADIVMFDLDGHCLFLIIQPTADVAE